MVSSVLRVVPHYFEWLLSAIINRGKPKGKFRDCDVHIPHYSPEV
jgi:hypothetical protein